MATPNKERAKMRQATQSLPMGKTLIASILAWYHANKRDLPWRTHPTAYGVWISEIMCQQTRMETAVPRWHAFLRRFPDLTALATATEYDVCEQWAGLGYYTRARNLHKAATIVWEQHRGVFPTTAADWQALPGIGPYTAGAIASTVYGQAAPIVDGNVIRLLSRMFCLRDPATTPIGRAAFWRHAKHLVEWAAKTDKPGDFNQALMELGSLVCTPRAPKCLVCPWQAHCLARREGVIDQLPVKLPKKAPVAMRVAFVIDVDSRGVLLWRRPLSGLWAGLWEPPSATGEAPGDELVRRGYVLQRQLGAVDHVLSHRLVRAEIYVGHRSESEPVEQMQRRSRVPQEEPLSSLARKALTLAVEQGALDAAGAA